MKRARRVILLGVLTLLGGAVASALVGEGIGLAGIASNDATSPQRFVAVEGKCVVAYDVKRPGCRFLRWDVEDLDGAAVSQYMYDKHIAFFSGQLEPSYLHCDAPESLPRWSRLWDSKNWPKDVAVGGTLMIGVELEAGVGWPFQALSMDWSDFASGEAGGGRIIAETPIGSPRALVWRPIPLGLLADTLFWSACLAVTAWCVRLFVRARRRRRGGCAACGYSLAGLSGGSACPECGAGAGGSAQGAG